MLRGESFEPKLTPETIHEYMDDLKSGTLKSLPMGGYEYSCCVEYLKKIRRELFKSRCKSKFMMITFDEYESGVVCPPLEDCLEMVAKEVGFAVVYEEVKGNKYTYTLKCTLGEKR